MSRFKVEQLCFDLQNSENAAKFKTDPEAYFAQYSLTEAEKEAVRQGDVGALYKMDVLTSSIACLAEAFGYSNATYVRRLREAAGLPEVPQQMEILKRRER